MQIISACKDYLWGGRRLVEEFGVESDKNFRQRYTYKT